MAQRRRQRFLDHVRGHLVGSICEHDFPSGSLRNHVLTIIGSLTTTREPQVVVKIAAMPGGQARNTANLFAFPDRRLCAGQRT